MHLDLKEHVTRLVYFALNLQDEIRSAPEEIDVQECRATCLELLKHFEQPGPRQETHRLAQYALTAWIDELLSRAKWPHADIWRAKPLEEELFGTACRHWRFFEQAELALRRQDWEALSVFQFCIEFGFRGIYANDRMKVRLNDPLPMARARAHVSSTVPLLAGVVLEERTGSISSSNSTGGTFGPASLSPSFTEHPASLLPPTLSEWSKRTFASLGKRSSGLFPTRFLVTHALGTKKLIKDWAIVMAVGFLISAVLFAMGH